MPYTAAVSAAPTTPESLGMNEGKYGSLMELAQGDLSSLLQPQEPRGGPAPASMSAASMAPRTGGSPSHWEQVAERMAANRYGWGPEMFKYLDWTISGGGPAGVVGESSWNPNAVNPAGAYGIPQMYAPAHPEVDVQRFMAHPRQQISWLLDYVRNRYGSPMGAYQAKTTSGTY
jgi:hypothetical protein